MSCILVNRNYEKTTRWGLCLSQGWFIVKRSDRSQILFLRGRRWTPTAAAQLPFLLLLWLALGAFPVWAQTGATLTGVVTDKTGAPLPGVAVTIKNLNTGETRT